MIFKSCSPILESFFSVLAARGLLNWMPDEAYLKIQYRIKMKKRLNLENPQTFNEKLQWLKLHDRRPEYTMMVDKYRVRDFVRQKLGEEYLIPLIDVWDDPEDIDFDLLPDNFVLKCNHNSGKGMCICKDKASLDIESVKSELSQGLKQNYFFMYREWPYRDVPRKIVCEKYMLDSETDELRDYKWYCFNGVPQILMINSNRSTGATKADYFDMSYNHLDIVWGYPNADVLPVKPIMFEEMKRISTVLSKGIPHVRVDLYECNQHIYFGEMTFLMTLVSEK